MKITSLKELRSLETGGYKFAGTFGEDDLMDFVKIKKALQEGKEPIMSASNDHAQVMPVRDVALAELRTMLERVTDFIEKQEQGEIRPELYNAGPAIEAVRGAFPELKEEAGE